MSTTVVREKRQTTLPQEICEAAGIQVNDHIAWSFEDGVIKGKKLVPDDVEVLELEDLDPETLLPKGEGKIDISSLVQSVRADRESR